MQTEAAKLFLSKQVNEGRYCDPVYFVFRKKSAEKENSYLSCLYLKGTPA
jgi:hypothetical protein